MTPLFGFANDLARRGFKVFRCAPGSKRPFRDGWQAEASNEFWPLWNLWNEPGAENCNPAISTDDLVVLDVDVAKGGLYEIKKLNLPRTFTVRSARGGYHFYFKPPAGSEKFQTRAYRLDGKTGRETFAVEGVRGVDVRAAGGLVVAPGAVFEGGQYSIAYDYPIAELPAELVPRLRYAPEKPASGVSVVGELDTPGAIAAATRWLETAAPQAVQYAGGDQTTYNVCCRVLDFGLSHQTALELLLNHWNDQCEPPWDAEDLDRKLSNAESYRQDSIGRDNPDRCLFEPVDSPLAGWNYLDDRINDGFFRHKLTDVEAEAIPPRPWIVSDYVLRRQVTLLVAPGATGKSLLTMQLAFAMAIGENSDLGFDVREQVGVLVINNEDPRDEMLRRAEAAHRHFGLDRRETAKRIAYYSGADSARFKLVERDDTGKLTTGEGLKMLARRIELAAEEKIGCVIIDPLVSVHEADENKNGEMEVVKDFIAHLAVRLNIAVVIAHHPTKPNIASSENYVGNINSARGASALQNGVRLGFTLYGMSEKDGEKYGIKARDRHRFIRLDHAKNNLTLSDGEPKWFRRESVKFSNGESVGVLQPVELVREDEKQLGQAVEVLASKMTPGTPLTLAAAVGLLQTDPMFADRSAAKVRSMIRAALVGDVTSQGKALSFSSNGTKDGGTISCALLQRH